MEVADWLRSLVESERTGSKIARVHIWTNHAAKVEAMMTTAEGLQQVLVAARHWDDGDDVHEGFLRVIVELLGRPGRPDFAGRWLFQIAQRTVAKHRIHSHLHQKTITALARMGATCAEELLNQELRDRGAEPDYRYRDLVADIFASGNAAFAYRLLVPTLQRHTRQVVISRPALGQLRAVVESAVRHGPGDLDARWFPVLAACYESVLDASREPDLRWLKQELVDRGLARLLVASPHPDRTQTLLELIRSHDARGELVRALLSELDDDSPESLEVVRRALESDNTHAQSEALARSWERGGEFVRAAEQFVQRRLSRGDSVPASVANALASGLATKASATIEPLLRRTCCGADPHASITAALALVGRDPDDANAWTAIEYYAPTHELPISRQSPLRRRVDELVLTSWRTRPRVDAYGQRERARVATAAWVRLGRPANFLRVLSQKPDPMDASWPFRFYGSKSCANRHADDSDILVRFETPVPAASRGRVGTGLTEDSWFDEGRYVCRRFCFMEDEEIQSSLRTLHSRHPISEATNLSVEDLIDLVDDPWTEWSMWHAAQPARLPKELFGAFSHRVWWSIEDWPDEEESSA